MRRLWGVFLYSVLAGFCIGLGGTVFLRVKDAFAGGTVVGALPSGCLPSVHGDITFLPGRPVTYLITLCLVIWAIL